jgi:hypothetical protein
VYKLLLNILYYYHILFSIFFKNNIGIYNFYNFIVDMNIYNYSDIWIKEQWEKLTINNILYLLVFYFIISYIIKIILQLKDFRLIYFTLIGLLLLILVQMQHNLSVIEVLYELIIL